MSAFQAHTDAEAKESCTDNHKNVSYDPTNFMKHIMPYFRDVYKEKTGEEDKYYSITRTVPQARSVVEGCNANVVHWHWSMISH